MTKAETEVAAAATGTEGRSVNQTMFAVGRTEAVAQSRRKSDLKAQLLGFENQRQSSAFQASQQIDHTYLPNPNPVASIMGFGADAYKIHSRYNTD